MTFTLEQFNQLATKAELKEEVAKLATKDDLKNFVTKTEFNEFEETTKAEFKELKNNVHVLKNDVHVLKNDMIEVKETLRAVTERISDVLTAVDGIAYKLDKQEMDFVSNMAAHDRFETRITRVEKHLDLKPSPGY